mmetsp:Transcript_56721/g.101906  ORF Transcript_56721/g.101906 Transcript_56721/m.101906 type:complete len:242 (+) Transcript_56721:1306-2031(+)
MLITGTPSSPSICLKKGMVDHSLGTRRRMMSQGTAEMYSSATMISPLRIRRCFTEPFSFTTILSSGEFRRTSPPRISMCSFIGAHRRSGWLPSRKACCEPSVSFRKRFIAVKTTVMDSLSGSMKSRAFAMLRKNSSRMRSGMPYFFMNSFTDMSSCLLMNFWPSMSIGSSGGAVWNFSGIVSIFWFIKMARAKLSGAGTPSKKSNVVNSPGNSCMAKIIWWRFHCKRSSMSSSLKMFIMFG